MFPYRAFETLGIEEYEIVDENGKVVIEGGRTEFVEIMEGKVTIAISISELPGGSYRLVVRGFVGGSKADQPLVLDGDWECKFKR
mgnify:CR=1 FL=1